MAKTCRRIEPKPQPMLSLPERTPLLLFSLAPVSAVAVQTAASKSIVIDADSIQKNMLTNREALRSKLACRPSVGCLVQRGILRDDGDGSRSRLRVNEREALKRKIEERPSKQKLVTQHILLSASNADPLIQNKAEVLKRCKLKDNLNKKLKQRPGPLELVTKKILQADAELEQAIEDMEVLSTACQSQPKVTTTCVQLSKVRKKSQQCHGMFELSTVGPNMVKAALLKTHGYKQSPSPARYKVVDGSSEISSAQSIGSVSGSSCSIDDSGLPDTTICAATSNGINDVSSTPGASDDVNSACGVASAGNGNIGDDSCGDGRDAQEIFDPSTEMGGVREAQSSYNLLLQQQQLYLQWQQDVEESRKISITKDESVFKEGLVDCRSNEDSRYVVTMNEQIQHQQTAIAATDCTPQTSSQHQPGSLSNASAVNKSPTHLNSPSVFETEKQKSKLSDFRVQDLKNECKKRQLPVSGAKPQLVERLKPYEGDILNCNNSGVNLTVSNSCIVPADACTSSDNVPIPSPASDSSTTSSRLPPISNVINDYLQHSIAQQPNITQAVPVQQQQQHQQSVLVHIPATSHPQPHQQQILHLVDSNGSVVATAAVPTGVQCCCIPSECSSTVNVVPNLVAQYPCSSDQMRGDIPAKIQVISSTRHIPVQSQTEPTFSFAQLGSGGQFTLVQTTQASDLSLDTHHVPTTTQLLSSDPMAAVSGSLFSQTATHVHPTTQIVQSVTGQKQNSQLVHPGISVLHPNQQPQQQHSESQQQQIPFSVPAHHPPNCILKQQPPPSAIFAQFVVNDGSNVRKTVQLPQEETRTHHAVCPSVQNSVPSLGCSASPVMADLASGNSPNIPSPSTVIGKQTPHADAHNYHIDPTDTNALLSATTLSIHEEMLRFQQRKIDELQKELHRSQQQLKHQQQVILAAKRAQQTKCQDGSQTDSGSSQQSQAEMWLNQLDIKYLNKFHIQLFLQHKMQQQQMQAQIAEQHNLMTAEQKLQEELHVEQAVQDIVRLIKQDARTALLIVQLLRKYQLERNQANVTAFNSVNINDKADSRDTSRDRCSCSKASPSPQQQLQQSQKMSCSCCCTVSSDPNDSSDQCMNEKAQQNLTIIGDEVAPEQTSIVEKTKPKKSSLCKVALKSAANNEGINDATEEKSPSANIDMEEIFRKVLEDASRALTADSAERPAEYVKQQQQSKSDLLDVPNSASKSPAVVAYERVDHRTDDCASSFGDADTCKTQHRIVTQSVPKCDQVNHSFMLDRQSQSSFMVGQAVESNTCTDQFKGMTDATDVPTTSDNSAPVFSQYLKNQAFDDLMDVLRDDRVDYNDESQAEYDSAACYGQEDLATLLDEEWFDRNTAMQATPAYTQGTEAYVQSQIASNQNSASTSSENAVENNVEMASASQNQLGDQSMIMDWLDLMLPSPGHDELDSNRNFDRTVGVSESDSL